MYQSILKEVDVPVLSQADCQTALRNTRLGSLFVLDNSFMCAGGEAGKDACTVREYDILSLAISKYKCYIEIRIIKLFLLIQHVFIN